MYLNKLGRNVLITPEEVIFHAPTKATLDVRIIEQSIIIAEERYIRPELDFAMYSDMVSQKNKLITSENIDTYQSGFEKYSLKIGDVISSLSFMSLDYQVLWTQHLWKLTAECVMLMSTPDGFVQFTSKGLVHETPTATPMGNPGAVTPGLNVIKWYMDKKQQDRIDPLIQALHNFLCQTKKLSPLSYVLYTKECPCDGLDKNEKSTDFIMNLYDDESIDRCGCR